MPKPPERPTSDPRNAGEADPGSARRVVASYERYELAEEAVDTLADRRFPVEHVAIVARDLTFVEQVTGRETLVRAARRSGLNGLAFGALFGLIFGFFAWHDPVYSGLILAVYGAVLGAIVGAIMGAVGHRADEGRRDFASTAGMEAGAYDVLVDAEHYDDARRILESSES